MFFGENSFLKITNFIDTFFYFVASLSYLYLIEIDKQFVKM